MERINPPVIKAYMVRNGQLTVQDALTELGIFSSFIIDFSKPYLLEHTTFGRLLKTKGKDSNEGGCIAGYAVQDSPILVEIDDLRNCDILPAVSDF